jgi:hypothetical protein
MNKYKQVPFFKIAVRFALVFLILVTLFEIVLISIKNMSVSAMISQLFLDGNWKYFIKRIGFMAAFYGVFMAGYYKFIKK